MIARTEAVAEAIYTSMYGNDASMPKWALVGAGCRDLFLGYARAAIEAADSALHMPAGGPAPSTFLPYADRLNADAAALQKKR